VEQAVDLPAERIVENGIAIGEAMLPALNAVIANHLSSHTPVVNVPVVFARPWENAFERILAVIR
jgi:hypothetical protein